MLGASALPFDCASHLSRSRGPIGKSDSEVIKSGRSAFKRTRTSCLLPPPHRSLPYVSSLTGQLEGTSTHCEFPLAQDPRTSAVLSLLLIATAVVSDLIQVSGVLSRDVDQSLFASPFADLDPRHAYCTHGADFFLRNPSMLNGLQSRTSFYRFFFHCHLTNFTNGRPTLGARPVGSNLHHSMKACA